MIKVTVCGHDSHHRKPCNISHPRGLNEYLLLLVKSDAWFYMNGERIESTPNMVILYNKSTPIHYGYEKSGYNDDWVHFTITEDEEDSLLSSLQLPFNHSFYPKEFYGLSQYIQLLSSEFRSGFSSSDQIQDYLMRALLFSLKESFSQITDETAPHKLYADLCNLRNQLYRNPSMTWNAQEMSRSVNISTSYFQHLYKSFFHCSCQKDIITARLELAKIYLTRGNMSIRNMAYFCGYESELHFMRQFKKFVGMTPSEFRNRQEKS